MDLMKLPFNSIFVIVVLKKTPSSIVTPSSPPFLNIAVVIPVLAKVYVPVTLFSNIAVCK